MDEKKNKRLKILAIVIIALVAICAAYFAVNYFEQENFYNSIKNVSDLENASDYDGEIIRNKTAPTNDEIMEDTRKSINTTSKEILMLEDLKKTLINDTLKEYVDIEINRLTCENRSYSSFLKLSGYYDEYKNGGIGYSQMLGYIDDNRDESDIYNNKTEEYKVESDLFLQSHSDMKERFDSLGIDEDFMYNQIEETKAETIL